MLMMGASSLRHPGLNVLLSAAGGRSLPGPGRLPVSAGFDPGALEFSLLDLQQQQREQLQQQQQQVSSQCPERLLVPPHLSTVALGFMAFEHLICDLSSCRDRSSKWWVSTSPRSHSSFRSPSTMGRGPA